ncbi:uncharacterized protein I303_105689 [Kwoniella dejecticola CBS 10117]|uniref:beta-glucosidase n=1 Tax=Kwoniella dejecticola CBS 10117 TaxID=1296121 RepID=A0A1A6A050_9TREE|nr:uncharacterized protein I303_05711 [Kwoniella dejecticola CBS 10117]OBR83433.1 hypothetical protein I303_05711 [Kwoniella dejecticola CBS 10117]
MGDTANTWLKPDFDIEQVLANLQTLDRVHLLRGGNGFSSAKLLNHGIPPVRMVDGPSGCRGTVIYNGTRANCFPCAVGIGSSFDLGLVKDMAKQLAREAHAKSSHILLGPTLNIIRSPLAGRGFELFSEDPLLVGKMGATYIKSLQEEGVANEQEFNKHTAETVVSDRALREIYLEPFRIAVREGDPWSTMMSYSKIHGVHGCDSKFLIDDVLRKEWGYGGTVISDWYGTHSTSRSIEAGMDLEMPGPSIWRTDAQVLSHLEANMIDKKAIEKCVRNMLKLVKRAIQSKIPFEGPEVALDTPEIRALLRRAAANAVVLLKNDLQVLPIGNNKHRKTPSKIAVFGHNAGQHFSSGGGAASVPLETFSNSPLSGIQAAAQEISAEVTYSLGTVAYQYVPVADRYLSVPSRDGVSGVARIEFWSEQPHDEWKTTKGNIVIEKPSDHDMISPTARCFMHDGVPDHIGKDGHYVRFTSSFIPDQDGDWRIGLASIDRANLFVDGQLVIGYDDNLKDGTMFFHFCHEERSCVLHNLKKGQKYQVELRCWDTTKLHSLPVKMPAGFSIGLVRELDPQGAIDEAVALAQTSDECIVMVGLNKEYESEGYDRQTMRLPGTSDKLVEAILAVRPDAIIITQSGMAVEMPWAEKAATILHAFYGGTSLGDGLADVLFGRVNPSAKLPMTFPKRIEGSSSYPHFAHLSPSHKQVVYAEDIYVGYRLLDRSPERIRFPFGHGLSYTTFAYSDLVIEAASEFGQFTVKFSIKNQGSLFGAESAQVYIRPLSSALPRPYKELKGFTKVFLTPHSSAQAKVNLDRSAFAYWDDREDGGSWIAEQGEYEVIVGASSLDLRLKAMVTLDRTEIWRGL